MIWNISLILLALWSLGMILSNTMGGYIHILLLLSLEAMLIRSIQRSLKVLNEIDRLFNLSL